MINFYHRFIPHAAALLHPLHGAAHNKVFTWTPQLQSSFDAAKAALSAAVLLVHPSHTAPTSITVDASDIAVGGALEQYLGGQWRPVAFFSRKLNKVEARYSAFDRELLAMYLGVRRFRYFVEGRPFTLFMDHKPLTYAFANASDSYSLRQQRHLAYVSEFTTDVRHIHGKDNLVADTLSRVVLDTSPADLEVASVSSPPIDFQQMAKAQLVDASVKELRAASSSCSLHLQDVDMADSTLLCDVSLGQPRPVVPLIWRRPLFDQLHGRGCTQLRSASSQRGC